MIVRIAAATAPGVTTNARDRRAASGRGAAGARGRLPGCGGALDPVEVDQVLGIEPEVRPVVAQEALRVDRAGQVRIVAELERGEIALPDLRVALDAGEVHTLPLAGGAQDLPELVDVTGHAPSSSSGT